MRKEKIVRQKCIYCNEIGHAHHYDYNKPMNVIWLCVKHHNIEHRKYKVA